MSITIAVLLLSLALLSRNPAGNAGRVISMAISTMALIHSSGLGKAGSSQPIGAAVWLAVAVALAVALPDVVAEAEADEVAVG
jgi:hypothetical membrane protein